MIKSLANCSITNQKKYRSMMAGSVENNADHLITETVLESAVSSVTFDVSSLAALGYKHLQVRLVTKSGTTTGAAGDMRFNGDSTASYATHGVYGNGSSATSGANYGAGTGGTSFVDVMDFSPSTSSGWQSGIIDILDAFSTVKNKSIRHFGGRVAGDISIYDVQLSSGVWLNTSALTSITLYARTQNLAVGSRFSLYASKG